MEYGLAEAEFMPGEVLANLAGSASCLRYSYAPNLHHSFAKLRKTEKRPRMNTNRNRE